MAKHAGCGLGQQERERVKEADHPSVIWRVEAGKSGSCGRITCVDPTVPSIDKLRGRREADVSSFF